MEIICDANYLILPVNRNLKKKKLMFYENNTLIFDLEVKLDFIHPDQEFYLNIERFAGKTLELRSEPEINLEVRKSDIKCMGEGMYKESYRPGFHFSAKVGWINDPNGLVYYNGHYLMFYQHNPVGVNWGNMHWGCAVSDDLVHWREKEIVLYPDQLGLMFSGSAIVDTKNATGLKEGENDVILLIYTAAGGDSELSKNQPFTQCLAYSTDNGDTYKKYDKNPIVNLISKRNRDPKIIYHPQTETIIMALFLTENRFALLSSQNLLDWTQIQEITLTDDSECPDFYPLPVDGDDKEIKWVFTGGADRYVFGSFDGFVFRPETETKRLHYAKDSYASQSWSDIGAEDGRRIRISWFVFEQPSMPFNNCMTFPCEMTLKTFSGEVFLCASPVKEIEQLYGEVEHLQPVSLLAGEKYTRLIEGNLYDIYLKIGNPYKGSFTISFFGVEISCNGDRNELKCLDNSAPLESYNDCIDLRILIDITGIEIFINGGKAFMAIGYIQDTNINRVEIEAVEKDIVLKEARIAELNAIWPNK